MNEKDKAGSRWRTTLIIESEPDDFEEALKHAVAAARERFINVSFALKTGSKPRIECRTSKIRKRKGD